LKKTKEFDTDYGLFQKKQLKSMLIFRIFEFLVKNTIGLLKSNQTLISQILIKLIEILKRFLGFLGFII